MFDVASIASIERQIAKGWKPNAYLTNMSIAYFQQQNDYIATHMFPAIPVQHSTSSYYIFSRADLARDNVQRKPQFGKVQPMVISSTTDTYRCEVDQVILGLDQIAQTDIQRANIPGAADPRKAKVQTATEQIYTHLDILWAKKFFQPGVWNNEMQGVTASPSGSQFLKFTDANFNPIQFFDNLKIDMKRRGRRKPNKICFGTKAWIGMKNNPFILDRVIGTGGTNNPALVTEKAVAEILGFDEVMICEGTFNAAGIGAPEDMRYICDESGCLVVHTPSSASIDTPSAGYSFMWDMLGNGQTIAFDQFEGERGTHTEFIEGLCSSCFKITAQDLGVYLRDCA